MPIRSKYNQQRILDSLFDFSKTGSGNSNFHHLRVDLVAAKHDIGFDFVNNASPSQNDINIFSDVRFENAQGQSIARPTSIRFGYDDIMEFLEFGTTIFMDPKTQLHMQVTPKVILIHEASETFPFRVELSSPDLTLDKACEILQGIYPFHEFLFPQSKIGTRLTLFIAPAWAMLDQTMQPTPTQEGVPSDAYPDLSAFMEKNMPPMPDMAFSNFPRGEKPESPLVEDKTDVFQVKRDPFSPEAELEGLMNEAALHVERTSHQEEIPQAPDSTTTRFVSDDMKEAIDQRSNQSLDLTKSLLEQAMNSGKILKDGQLVDAPAEESDSMISTVDDLFPEPVSEEENTGKPSYAETEKDTKPYNENPVMAALVQGMPTASSDDVIDIAAEVDQQVARIKEAAADIEAEEIPQAPDSTD